MNRKGQPWTDEEEAFVEYHLSIGTDRKSIADAVGRTENAINCRYKASHSPWDDGVYED